MTPLDGVRVLDLTHAFAGPYCTFLLGRLGAEVVKVEPPQGDDFRARPVFDQINSGKRSIVIDMKQPRGHELVRRLAAEADVVVENYRPGVASSLGVDWETLREVNPRLIYCSISGFGQTGPLRDHPAIEWTVQAATGVTSLYLHADSDPLFNGLLLLDPFSGFMAHSSVLAALLERQRTGGGQHLDVAMSEGAFLLQVSELFESLQGNAGDKRRPPRRPTMARFATRDGQEIFIAALHDKWFAGLCNELGAVDLLADERFVGSPARLRHTDELYEALQAHVRTRAADDLETALVRQGIPAATVRTIADFATSPQRSSASLITDVALPDGSVAKMFAPTFGSTRPSLTEAIPAVPALGEHSEQLLRDLGCTDSEIKDLLAAQVVGAGEVPHQSS